MQRRGRLCATQFGDVGAAEQKDVRTLARRDAQLIGLQIQKGQAMIDGAHQPAHRAVSIRVAHADVFQYLAMRVACGNCPDGRRLAAESRVFGTLAMRRHARGSLAGFTVAIEIVGVALRRQAQGLVGQQQAEPRLPALLVDPVDIAVCMHGRDDGEQDDDGEMTLKTGLHGMPQLDACRAG